MHKIFGCPIFFESLKGSPQNLRRCETNTIDRVVITLLSKTFLMPEHFWNTEGFAHYDFRRRETKKNQQNRDTLISKNFSIAERLRNTRVPLRNFSLIWDKKDWQNRDTPTTQKFLIPEHFWKTEGFTHDVFRRCEAKKFRRKNVKPPSISISFSILGIFWNTKGFLYEVFRYCETKGFRRKIVKLPYYA